MKLMMYCCFAIVFVCSHVHTGNIALIQRGGCSFQLKAENAAKAGAVGAIIFNQGDDGDGRKGKLC